MAGLVSGPAWVLAAATLVYLGLTAAGRDPFWAPLPATLSDAAASGDAGEVARLLAAGHDPNARYAVRPGRLSGRETVTPLEAAEKTGRPEIAALLARAGARPVTLPADVAP